MNDIYTAGLFDGEGWVRIAKWQKPNSFHIRYQVLVGIGMTHRPVIEALRAEYAGTINENRSDLRKSTNRIQFIWRVASQKAADFLRRIEPHSTVKRDQIQLALELQTSIDTYRHKLGCRYGNLHPDHADIRAHREELVVKIAAHKKIAFPSYSELAP